MFDISFSFFLENILIVNMLFWLLTLVGERFFKSNSSRYAKEVFECGFFTTNSVNITFNYNFFIIGALLILYDIEFFFLVPFLFNWDFLNLFSFSFFFLFFTFIFISFILDWEFISLDWTV